MGKYLTDLADTLRSAGLSVVEVAGWRTRGYRGGETPDGGLLSVSGILGHHTGTPQSVGGNYPTLATVCDGRTDVPGPLAQLGLGRDGTWYVIAAGRANHAGAVDDARYSNPRSIGVEAEHPGGTAPWPDTQYRSYVRGVAALQRHYATAPVRGHKEAAVPYGRKPDPNFDMTSFRAAVAAATASQEDDMTFDAADRQRLIDIRATQLEDSKTFREVVVPAIEDIKARVESMHMGNYLPVGEDGESAKGGTLAWLDQKLAALPRQEAAVLAALVVPPLVKALPTVLTGGKFVTTTESAATFTPGE